MIPFLMMTTSRSDRSGFTFRQRLLLLLAFILGMATASVTRGCLFQDTDMTQIQTRMNVCINDLHLPFVDPTAVKMALNFIRDERPGRIHLLGDICDIFSLSRFDKDPNRRLNLQEELDTVRDWLVELRDAAPRAKIIYSEGNHEFRLRKYLMSEAKALAGLRALSLDKLLDFDKLRIRWQAQDRPYRVGHLLFTHGSLISKWSACSAKRHFERYGCCTIHGHTHRLGAFYHTDITDTFGAWENGCLCSLTPDYMTAPDWQHGFSVVWTERSGFFHVEQVAIVRGVYCWHGRVIGKKRDAPHVVEEIA